MVFPMEEPGRSRIKNQETSTRMKHLDTFTDGYFSWTAPAPVMSRDAEIPQLPYTHFALIAIDRRGCVQYHTSKSLEKHCRHIFTPDVKERFIHATGVYGRPQPAKKRRLEPELEIPDVAFESVDRVPLRVGDEEKILDYYESAFRAFQQINCRQIAKAFIKIIEPRKQVKHPYNGGRGASGERGDPEKTKPDWWPAGVIHREPDHLKKPERIRLLVHIIRNLRKSHNITTDKLEEAGRDVKRQIKPRERWDILEEIYAVRRAEESFERGESDADAVVYVVNRDSANKHEQDSECLSDSGHTPAAKSHTFDNKDPFMPTAVSGYANERYSNEVEESKPAIKYLPAPDFIPSPIEQISTPMTAETWSFHQPMFPAVTVAYENSPAPISIPQQQVLSAQPLTPTTAPDMHMRMQSQFDFMPLGAPTMGSIGHPHLLHSPPHHHGGELISHYK